jgi:hypothetical protein
MNPNDFFGQIKASLSPDKQLIFNTIVMQYQNKMLTDQDFVMQIQMLQQHRSPQMMHPQLFPQQMHSPLIPPQSLTPQLQPAMMPAAAPPYTRKRNNPNAAAQPAKRARNDPAASVPSSAGSSPNPSKVQLNVPSGPSTSQNAAADNKKEKDTANLDFNELQDVAFNCGVDLKEEEFSMGNYANAGSYEGVMDTPFLNKDQLDKLILSECKFRLTQPRNMQSAPWIRNSANLSVPHAVIT